MKAAFVVLLMLVALPARADDAAVARSKACFERGKELFDAGQFSDAAKQFEAGYALVPKPLFLVNLGMSYKKLGETRRARTYFQQYLDVTPEDAPQRPDVENAVREIDTELGSLETHPAVVVPARRGLLTDFSRRERPPAKKSWAARNWWVFPVGGAVLTGLAVGIYYAARPHTQAVDCAGATWCFP